MMRFLQVALFVLLVVAVCSSVDGSQTPGKSASEAAPKRESTNNKNKNSKNVVDNEPTDVVHASSSSSSSSSSSGSSTPAAATASQSSQSHASEEKKAKYARGGSEKTKKQSQPTTTTTTTKATTTPPPPPPANAAKEDDEGPDFTVAANLVRSDDTNTAVQSATSSPTPSPSSSTPIARTEETADESRARWLVAEAVELTQGNNTDTDLTKAFALLQQAEQLGSVNATYYIAMAYKLGYGVAADTSLYHARVREACDKGHAGAQRERALMYFLGLGEEKDEAMGVLYAHFSAAGGDLMSQMMMGYRHAYGYGVPLSCSTAVLYYMPVAEAVANDVHASRGPPIIEKTRITHDTTMTRAAFGEDDEVVQYYQYSAERGDASAQTAMGQLYFYGARGMRRNVHKAMRYFDMAAEQGDGNAMSHLGHMYAHGIAVEQDYDKALDLFRKAAELGSAAAQNGLGYMHMYGRGLEQSYARAKQWFSKASDGGSSEGRFNLAALHIGGYGVKKDYAKGLYHLGVSANQGHLLALFNLAMMHLNGFGTPRNCATALQFFKRVAERGVWGGQLQEAYHHFSNGDVSTAVKLYLESAELGFEAAQSNLAVLLDAFHEPYPSHVTDTSSAVTSHQAALHWYSRAADQGNIEAHVHMGDMHYYGHIGGDTSVKQDLTLAAHNYRIAADARHPQALFNLGYMHHRGEGIARDRHLAKRYYDMSAETSKDAVLPVKMALWVLSMEVWIDETLTHLDTALPLLFQRLRIPYTPPRSEVWVGWLVMYWDVCVGAWLAGLLIVVLTIRAYLLR